MGSHTPSQRYLSSRGGSYGLSFEDVVLKGLAPDGGLFIPEEIPSLPQDWASEWKSMGFSHLAYSILSFYISPAEIPSEDLKKIVDRSYATFRTPDVTPLVTLDESQQIHLLELFHGPTFAFKDVALQFLGNLFEYFLVRRNSQKPNSQREHLTIVGATSGDTGSAAIYGLRGKQDVSVFIMFPDGKVSPVQEAQMTSVLDDNVHSVALDGTFDDCQDFLKSLFADPDINSTHKLGAVNSINWARILAQITYYFYAYLSLSKIGKLRSDQLVRFVVPTGNFGDILAGYFAKKMGLPIDKLVVATNENDILHRFWKTGYYEKKPVHGQAANGGLPEDGAKAHEDGVRETLSPAMDILVSSNFERLLWFLAFTVYGQGDVKEKRKVAGSKVKGWLGELKDTGGFGVEPEILKAAKVDFESQRISDKETLNSIKDTYSFRSPAASSARAEGVEGTTYHGGYIIDPHTAIGVEASRRSAKQSGPPTTHHISLATAHPAKFSNAVELALKQEPGFDFSALLPMEFRGLEDAEKRVIKAKKSDGFAGIRSIIRDRVAASSGS